VDAFLVTLQGIAAAPPVRAALMAQRGAAAAENRPPPGPPLRPVQNVPAPAPAPTKPSLWPDRGCTPVPPAREEEEEAAAAPCASPVRHPPPPAALAAAPPSPAPRRPPHAPPTPPTTDLFAFPAAHLTPADAASWATPAAPAWADPAWAGARPFLSGECLALADGGDWDDGRGRAGGHAGADPTAPPPPLAAQVVAGGGLPPALGGLPPAAQEAAVLEDLLYAWLGCDGMYLRARPVFCPAAASTSPTTTAAAAAAVLVSDGEDGGGSDPTTPSTPSPVLTAIEWRLVPGGDGSVDAAVGAAAARLAALARAAAALDRFARSRASLAAGGVAHGAAAAAATALQRWRSHVAAMDEAAGRGGCGGLTLPALAAATAGEAPPLLAAGAAVEAAAAAAPLTSPSASAPALLDSLHASWTSERGDAPREAAVAALLAGAAGPWFASLEAWVVEGRLDDPHGEGPVEVVDGEARLRVEPGSERVAAPAFVAPAVLGDALAAGQAAAALREGWEGGGGGPGLPTPSASTPLAWDPAGGYARSVSAAATAASAALLALAVQGGGAGGGSGGAAEAPADARAAARLPLPAVLAAARGFLLLGAPGFGRALATGETGAALAATPADRMEGGRLAALVRSAAASGAGVCGGGRAEGTAAAALAALVPSLDGRSMLASVKAARDADAAGGRAAPPHLTPAQAAAAAGAGAGARPARAALVLSLAPPWPASTLLAPGTPAAAYYGLLFRHLHGLVAAQAGLDDAWRVLGRAARRPPRAAAGAGGASEAPPPAPPPPPPHPALARALAARAAMAASLAALASHAQADVIEPAWARLGVAVASASTLGGVAAAHERTLRSIARGCLLTRGVPALRGVTGLVEASHAFVAAVRGLEAAAGAACAAADAAAGGPGPGGPAGRLTRSARALAAAAADPAFVSAAASAEATFRERVADLVGGLDGFGEDGGEAVGRLVAGLRAAVGGG